MKALLTILLNLAVLLSCTPRRQASQLLTLTGNTMGTVYSVKIVREEASTAGIDSAAVHSGIDSLLQEVNRQMSTYLPQSEISRFNRSTETGWFPVSPGLYLVLNKAREVSQISGGRLISRLDLWSTCGGLVRKIAGSWCRPRTRSNNGNYGSVPINSSSGPARPP